MSDVAIAVEGLSKRYRIGLKDEVHETFAGALADFATRPIRNFRRLRRLSRFSSNGQDFRDVIWALKGVSFEVNHGEVVGIIGPNGAGKTTLLKVITHITEPTSGRVVVRGRVSGLLEAGTGFHPELTGRENVYLSGTLLGMSRNEVDRRFDAIVDFSGVEKFIDTPVKRYSSGMNVRLAFAVAAHLEPEILLVDEVLAVGDAEFQKKCLMKMKEFSRDGRTVLFVSHNMSVIQHICRRGVLLTEGQISTDGPIRTVIDMYMAHLGGGAGEVSWSTPSAAPGDQRTRLKAVRVVSEGRVTRQVDISKGFTVEVDYLNLEPDSRRWVSLHVYDTIGTCVLTSANIPSASRTPDPWYDREFPAGEFRTSCAFPGFLLNEGTYNLTVFIQGAFIKDTIVRSVDVLSIAVINNNEDHDGENELIGERLGVVRPILGWQTDQLS